MTMKKVLLVCLILFITFGLFATSYTVETKYGEKEVVVPEGYSELDVLLIIAKNYYELYEESQELQDKVTELNGSINSYVSENQTLRTNYTNLTELYSDLIAKYEVLSKVDVLKGYVGGGLKYSYNTTMAGFNVELGAFLFEKVLLKANFGFDFNAYIVDTFELGIGFGFLF